MYVALENSCRGLVPGQDAPDIVANTMLENVTEEQMSMIYSTFRTHSHHKHLCVYSLFLVLILS
jgi:hypothetical protein